MKTKNYTCPLCQKQISVTVYDPLNRVSVARKKFELAVKEHLQTHTRLTPAAPDAAWPPDHKDEPFCECSVCMGFTAKPAAPVS